MKRLASIVIATLALLGVACAAGYSPWTQPSGETVDGAVLNCATGNGREVVPCGTAANPMPTSVMPASGASGGLAVFRVTSPAGATGIAVQGAAGRLFSFYLCNTAGSSRYVRFYNAVTATPGTTPVYAGAIVIPAGSCQAFATNFGLTFSTGISMAITAANGDGDATAGAAGDVSGFLGYL